MNQPGLNINISEIWPLTEKDGDLSTGRGVTGDEFYKNRAFV
jgi:hypothetical protein